MSVLLTGSSCQICDTNVIAKYYNFCFLLVKVIQGKGYIKIKCFANNSYSIEILGYPRK